MKFSDLPFAPASLRASVIAKPGNRIPCVAFATALCVLLPLPAKVLGAALPDAGFDKKLTARFSALHDQAVKFQATLAQNKPATPAATPADAMPNMPRAPAAPAAGAAVAAPSPAPAAGGAMPMPMPAASPAPAPGGAMPMPMPMPAPGAPMAGMMGMMGMMNRMMSMMEKEMAMPDPAAMPAGGMKMGMGMGMNMMAMDKMGMMDMMGMKDAAPMRGMEKSALPGFPGASHLYHLGATELFLDHSTHITLTTEQMAALNKIKEQSLLAKASVTRQVEQAEQDLWTLTASDKPDLAKIEAKVREIEKLNGDSRIAFIKAVGGAAALLTDAQRKTLTGFAPPAPANSAGPAAPRHACADEGHVT